ncbi:MAG: hypothetical protein H0T60_16315 [Acidobacteria bacterium]|nr:hypothetical protein [Acidobacteriota bacterium]
MSEEVKEKEARDVVRKETWSSEVYIVDSSNVFDRMESDGEFVLEINGATGKITGTHSHPEPHDVTGKILPTNPPGILLLSVDGVRAHTGGLKEIDGKQYYIGARLPLARLLRQQEEGVWVGTKV